MNSDSYHCLSTPIIICFSTSFSLPKGSSLFSLCLLSFPLFSPYSLLPTLHPFKYHNSSLSLFVRFMIFMSVLQCTLCYAYLPWFASLMRIMTFLDSALLLLYLYHHHHIIKITKAKCSAVWSAVLTRPR